LFFKKELLIRAVSFEFIQMHLEGLHSGNSPPWPRANWLFW